MFFICVRKRFFPFEECPPLYHLMIVSSLRTSAKKYDKEKWLSSRSLLIPVHTSNACQCFRFLMGAPRVWMLLPHQYCTPCFPALECIVWVGTLKLGINHTKHMMSLCKEAQSNFPGKIKGSQGKKCPRQNTLPNRWNLGVLLTLFSQALHTCRLALTCSHFGGDQLCTLKKLM